MKAVCGILLLFVFLPVLESCAWMNALKGPEEVVRAPNADEFMAQGGLAEAGVATNPNAFNQGEDISPAVVPNGIYSFKNVMSGFCLEFPESDLRSDPPKQMRCRNTETQQFDVNRKGANNSYTIKNRKHELFLQNKARMAADGGQFELIGETRDKVQSFGFDRKTEAQFAIRSLFSGRVLEVTDNNANEGAVIQQAEYEGHTQQVWQLIQVGTIDPLP